MRVLHVVKTAEGADWAAREVTELVKLGIEVHVAVPNGSTENLRKWVNSGAELHLVNLDLPIKSPFRLSQKMSQARALVNSVKPDLIHSHFFGTSILLRYALGPSHPIPRIFQVPGPLHLEHRIFRSWELSSSGPSDFWIASSEYIRNLYLKAGISPVRVSLSYYGIDLPKQTPTRSFKLHEMLGLPKEQKIIGNVSHIYKPKIYLGQTKGIKCHEDLIDAFDEVTRIRPDITGVLIGGAWKGAESYEKRLIKRAHRVSGNRVRMLGNIRSESILSLWADFDLAVHVPRSENCGGVVEPLLAMVPVIASNVGGLPDVIQDGVTGTLVPPENPKLLARAILKTMDSYPLALTQAKAGEAKVRQMFDVTKTSREIVEIYRHTTATSLGGSLQ